ncbi:MAG: GerMN domain-containing protein [Minisyncoccia bacterium]
MMQKYSKEIIITFLSAIVLFGSILGFNFYRKTHPGVVDNTPKNITGLVTEIAASAKVITIVDAKNQTYSLATVSTTKFLDVDSKEIAFKDIYKGFTIEVQGEIQNDNIILPNSIKIVDQPNILIYSPTSGTKISNYFIVKGFARVFENTFSIRLKDAVSNTLYFEKSFMTKTGELGQYGEINHAISLGEAATDINDKASLILEVFEYSAKDGLEVNKVSVPLIFSKPFTSTTKVSGGPTTTMNGVEETVKIYFNNNKLDPEISCNKVFPVERKLIINDDFDRTVRLVLEQLLFGPNQTEITDNYSTSLPVNVKINKTNLVDGELTVDFDNQLQAGIGGSCRVSAIRTQITKTLMDLPGVDSVIISIDGNIKDILQP